MHESGGSRVNVVFTHCFCQHIFLLLANKVLQLIYRVVNNQQ